MTPYRVMIVDDHDLARTGLAFLVGQDERYTLVTQACNGQEAVTQAFRYQPDLVLMDVEMPVMDGISATQALKDQQVGIKVIMLTSCQGVAEVHQALASGADAYCLKDIQNQQLLSVMALVLEGGLWLDSAVAKTLIAAVGSSGKTEQVLPMSTHGLSTREWDILRLIVEGYSNDGIAGALCITPNTVKTHIRHIMEKLAVDDRTQAAVKAIREGWLS